MINNIYYEKPQKHPYFISNRRVVQYCHDLSDLNFQEYLKTFLGNQQQMRKKMILLKYFSILTCANIKDSSLNIFYS